MHYIAYDFETTGLDFVKDQPIEIGILKVDEQGNIEEHDIFITTPEPLSEEIKRITNISDEMLNQDGIGLEPAMKKMFEVMGIRKDGYDEDVKIIGHNIIGFDNWFLKKYAEEYGYKFPEREVFFDTAGEFRSILIGEQRYVHECDYDFHDRILRMDIKGARYNLGAACRYYNIVMDKAAHRANNDCLYTLKVFEKQKDLSLLKYVVPSNNEKSNTPTMQETNGQSAFNF